MTPVADIATRVADAVAALPAPAPRNLVALAGPPGAGKSTVAAALHGQLLGRGIAAAVVPMDGFHLDNAILAERGLSARKGAPETFDLAGFAAMLTRLRTEAEVFIPVFDRATDMVIVAGAVIAPGHTTLIVEGNYLLLDAPGWRALAARWALSVFLSVPVKTLERRLVARWRGHGLDAQAARARALANDIPNARLVTGRRLRADLVLS